MRTRFLIEIIMRFMEKFVIVEYSIFITAVNYHLIVLRDENSTVEFTSMM